MAHPIVPVLLAGLTVLTVLSVLSVLSVLAAGENQPKPRHPVKSVPETAADLPAPLPPEQSRLRMQVPDGFTVELVAAEPDIVKPIAIAFDERGRAWVAQSTDYPHDLAADGRGHDRISICEDSDGDGRADRFTVFANDLNIPTGLVVVPGGVVVANAPDLLLLTDRDGDGRADDRRVLYTGFGRRDTHAQVSNLRHGPDGWLWGTVGYSGGKILVGGQVHSIGAGVFRCRLDGSAFEFVTATGSNTWGLGFDAIGNAFISKANAAHCLQLAIPDRHFTAVRGWKATGSLSIADHNQPQPITTDVRVVEPGFTATCGMALATSSALPAEWQERMAMVCEPTSHLVHLDRLERDGTRFAAKDAGNLLASSDAWTAPVDVTIGPDGQIWVLDWYNYIIRHNPTPKGYQTGPGGAYRTEFRDQKHGRIWRVRRGARTATCSGA